MPPELLEDRVVIVTGAGSGIGAATAQLFARLGARVVLTGRDEAKVRSVALDGAGAARASCRVLDVRDPDAWRRVVDGVLAEHGRIDVLVNNAALVEPGRLDELDPASIERQLATNLGGVLHGCRAVLPSMRARRQGVIVNVGSLAGIMPMPFEAVLCATKHAVRGLTFSLREELRGTGVRVAVVACDSVATPMLEHESHHEGAWMSFVDAPLSPEQVARAVVKAAGGSAPEVIVPSATGWLARVSMCAPRLVLALMPVLRWRGTRRQARVRRSLAPGGPGAARPR